MADLPSPSAGPPAPAEQPAPASPAGSGSRIGHNFAKAALLIAVLTVFARIAGFGRNVVFANTVGQTCLGQTYQTVNTVPNIIFEIVAGGALASVVVPLLSSAITRGDREHASKTSSALVTWALSVLAPIALLVALFAEPITRLLLGGSQCDGAVTAGATMLRIFAPQIVLYGVGVVLTGILQAHRKFGGPAFAPLLSSLVVIAAYVTFAVVAGRGATLQQTSASEQLILSLGTTLGVVALSGSLLVPLRGTGLRFRPTYRFPPGVARRAAAMAASGVAGLLAQQCAVIVSLVLTNQQGVPTASINVFVYAQTIYLLPWAILAVPIATSVFPKLSEDADAGDMRGFRLRFGNATDSIVAFSGIATAALIAAAAEIAYVYVRSAPGEPSVHSLTDGIVGFTVGLVGYSLFAIGSRALFALGDARGNAIAAVGGWGLVVVAGIALSFILPKGQRVAALTWGNAIGVTVLGIALLVTVGVKAGRRVAADVTSALATGVAAVAVGLVTKWVTLPGPLQIDSDSSIWAGFLAGGLRGLIAVVVCGVILFVLPGSPIRGLVARRRKGAQEPHDAYERSHSQSETTQSDTAQPDPSTNERTP